MLTGSRVLAFVAAGLSLTGAVALSGGRCGAQSTAQAMTAPAHGPVTHVVELFTSQGCSSCPKADALFASYVKRPDVLALSFSVDYWDYLGWRDTNAKPEFTLRQKRYAKLRGDGQVYTPQMIVNGLSHTVGHSAPQVDTLLHQAAGEQSRVWHSVDATATSVRIGPMQSPRASTVWLVKYVDRTDVEIRRGENAGHTIAYHNVVRQMTELGDWDGRAEFASSLSGQVGASASERHAVLLQDNATGRIVGAARVP